MKVTDTRDGRILAGRCVSIIGANQAMHAREVERLYGITSAHRSFAFMAAACGYERLVMRIGQVTDHHYRILQRHAHHKVEPEDLPEQDALVARQDAES